MKILALMGLMCTALWAGDNYQTCGLVVASGEVICGDAKNRQGAELQALAYNALAHGQFVAWVQRIPKGKHKVTPQTDTQPQSPAEGQPSVPTDPTTGKSLPETFNLIKQTAVRSGE